ncbi:bacteriocin immunity protein [Enterococcus columbae]|uniref:Bacteriocin immunity protein n=1 Tax=Enterococcus columbae DSM 7374 = ATCC 51263 TaxID=1121865 RepID=S0KHE0_9ENTE|nr:bacteriocin immunity protein [Enterococcus columbae]EOT39538.1 hypothetical protein OMW_01925 [Enterococcus columbae DSM 7374 = ATCC 51263]EOW80018.1 hypothetical protein I568_02369 [Enterococcus columbae DSM 7374 = ATCC 51263]OJG23952.1 hypothetical protein RR47_GL000361 [Enterococcus columbae DSM 7374 = ATCC 51263]
MAQLKWYAGGQERGKVAVDLLTQLISELKASDDDNKKGLADLVQSFINEIKQGICAVPLSLSRLNIEVSNYLTTNQIVLSEKESKLFKEVAGLSQIRYGY